MRTAKPDIWAATYAAAFVSSVERCRKSATSMRSLGDVLNVDHAGYAITVADCAVDQLERWEEEEVAS